MQYTVGQLQKEAGRWTLQGGLRYEMTSYNANQLGNITRDRILLFPQLQQPVSLLCICQAIKADSLNSLPSRTERRIDRRLFRN